MPTYAYACDRCEHREDKIRPVSQRGIGYPCPECGTDAGSLEDGVMQRDAMASMKPHTDTGFQKEHLSRALGVPADQVKEMQAKFPHHRFAPDGRMIFSSAKEFDRVKKDLGFEHR